jgi:hypothetical protein
LKKRTLAQLKKDAWKVFSIWVRKNEADWRGYVACCSCGQKYIWNSGEIHAGHWIHDKLDYDPRNVHPQCYKCNLKFNWKKATTGYAVYMAKRYGPEEMEKLRREAYLKGNAYTRQELEKVIEKYTLFNAALI